MKMYLSKKQRLVLGRILLTGTGNPEVGQENRGVIAEFNYRHGDFRLIAKIGTDGAVGLRIRKGYNETDPDLFGCSNTAEAPKRFKFDAIEPGPWVGVIERFLKDFRSPIKNLAGFLVEERGRRKEEQRRREAQQRQAEAKPTATKQDEEVQQPAVPEKRKTGIRRHPRKQGQPKRLKKLR